MKLLAASQRWCAGKNNARQPETNGGALLPPNLKGEEEGEEEVVVEASVIVDDVQGPDSPKAYTSVSAAVRPPSAVAVQQGLEQPCGCCTQWRHACSHWVAAVGAAKCGR